MRKTVPVVATCLLLSSLAQASYNSGAPAQDFSQITAASPVREGEYQSGGTCDLILTRNGESLIAHFAQGSAKLRYCDGTVFFLVSPQTSATFVGAGGAKIIGVNEKQILVSFRGQDYLFTGR